MRRLVLLALLTLATTAVPVAAQEGEATQTVTTAAQYRSALTAMSAVTSGTNTIRIGADFTLNADNEPTYTGTRPLVIQGQGHTISGNDFNRLVDHRSTARLTVRNLTFTDGLAPEEEEGGAIAADGPVTLTTAVISTSATENADGGALFVAGSLTMTDSRLDANVADQQSGGGAYVEGDLTATDSTFTGNQATDAGGALLVEGSVTVTGSTFDTNTTPTHGGGGGAIHALGTALTVTGSAFTGNGTGEGGGAIHAAATVTSTITGSGFTDNSSVFLGPTTNGGGGAVELLGPATISDSVFEANSAATGSGGAVRVEGPTATLTGVEILDNEALEGGGIGSTATALTVEDSWVEDNRATTSTGNHQGGGIRATTATVRRTSVTGNEAGATSGFGGGISVSSSLVLEDSDVASNTADDFGGGVHAASSGTLTIERSSIRANTSTNGQGGGIWAGNTLVLTNSTVEGNQAVSLGGGIATDEVGTTTLVHATIVRNMAATSANVFVDDVPVSAEATVIGEAQGGGADCSGNPLTSNGHNAESGTSCDFTGTTDQQSVTDLGLGRLRRLDRDLPTFRFPLAGSVLVDHVPAGDCPEPADQNGVDRPFGAGCDIGAVEQLFPEHDFTDVPVWVADAVRWIAYPTFGVPLMEGFDDDTFRTGDPITRAQVVRLLHREAGEPDPLAYGPHPFTDVPAWVEDAVRWAFGEGIVTGETPTTFAPNDPITRAQVVRMTYRFAGSQAVGGIDPHPFTDVPPWVEDAVRWAANPDHALPLVTGETPTTFAPSDDITRGQVVRMNYRLALTPGAWDDPEAAASPMLFQGNLF